jgi:hypothetical protein
MRVDRANTGGAKAKGHLHIGDIGSPADYAVGPDSSIHVHIKPTTQYAEAEILRKLRTYASGERALRVRIDHRILPSKFLASVVKAAYLGLFTDWGYRYILLPSLDRIRRAIREEGPDRERLYEIVVPTTITESSAGDLRRFSFEALLPPGIPTATSIINLPSNAGAFWVVLPPMSDPHIGSWDGLARAASGLQGKSNISLELTEHGKVIINGLA